MSTFATAHLSEDESDSDFVPEEAEIEKPETLPAAPSQEALQELAALNSILSPRPQAVSLSPEELMKQAAAAAARVMLNQKKAEEESKREVTMKYAGEEFSAMGIKRGRANNTSFEEVVKEITKKKPLNSMSKSQVDWELYKGKERIEDKLATNRKDGFVKKAKFLVESVAKEKEQLKKKRRGNLD